MVLSLGAVLLVLPLLGCATRLDAARARYLGPQYVVTRHFYDEAPQRVTVLPFATPASRTVDERMAELSRRVFFQHLVLRDFERVEWRQFDRTMLATSAPEGRVSVLSNLMEAIRMLDVVGMTTVVDLAGLFQKDRIDQAMFTEMVRRLREDMPSDAYVLGITRDFGRFYAVVLSSVGVSTRLEMRSTRTDLLMWRAQKRTRTYDAPITINPLDLPRRLYETWAHSRGLALDALAYHVFGSLNRTLPYMGEPGTVYIEATARSTPYFRNPTVWMLRRRGRVPSGARVEFLLEQNGWFLGRFPDGKRAWMFRRHARLVDPDGEPVLPFADLDW